MEMVKIMENGSMKYKDFHDGNDMRYFFLRSMLFF